LFDESCESCSNNPLRLVQVIGWPTLGFR
jgi:hypothetical protein